jgi:hypothetical protein
VLDETKATNGEVAPGQYVAWNHNANLQIVEGSQLWDSNLRTDEGKRAATKRRKRDAKNKALSYSKAQQELKAIRIHSKEIMDRHVETHEEMKRRHVETQGEFQEVKDFS